MIVAIRVKETLESCQNDIFCIFLFFNSSTNYTATFERWNVKNIVNLVAVTGFRFCGGKREDRNKKKKKNGKNRLIEKKVRGSRSFRTGSRSWSVWVNDENRIIEWLLAQCNYAAIAQPAGKNSFPEDSAGNSLAASYFSRWSLCIMACIPARPAVSNVWLVRTKSFETFTLDYNVRIDRVKKNSENCLSQSLGSVLIKHEVY